TAPAAICVARLGRSDLHLNARSRFARLWRPASSAEQSSLKKLLSAAFTRLPTSSSPTLGLVEYKKKLLWNACAILSRSWRKVCLQSCIESVPSSAPEP